LPIHTVIYHRFDTPTPEGDGILGSTINLNLH